MLSVINFEFGRKFFVSVSIAAGGNSERLQREQNFSFWCLLLSAWAKICFKIFKLRLVCPF